MRAPVTYQIREYGANAPNGITRPQRGSLRAYFKRDGDESRYCVYNEYVALQLAQIMGVPVASGSLAAGRDSLHYASLEICRFGISLPDLYARHVARVCERYPHECAGILVLDAWVGNRDRLGNLRANIATNSSEHLVVALDHSHCLLDVDEGAQASLQLLGSGKVIIKSHPFANRLPAPLIQAWLHRVQVISNDRLREVCVYSRAIGAATRNDQEDVLAALLRRRKRLGRILGRLAQ